MAPQSALQRQSPRRCWLSGHQQCPTISRRQQMESSGSGQSRRKIRCRWSFCNNTQVQKSFFALCGLHAVQNFCSQIVFLTQSMSSSFLIDTIVLIKSQQFHSKTTTPRPPDGTQPPMPVQLLNHHCLDSYSASTQPPLSRYVQLLSHHCLYSCSATACTLSVQITTNLFLFAGEGCSVDLPYLRQGCSSFHL